MALKPDALPPPVIGQGTTAHAAEDRRGLASVSWFVGICLILAAIAFLPAIPTDLSPFMLALGPLVIAVAVAWREERGAVRRLFRTLTTLPADARWYLVLLVPVVWALSVVLLAVVLGEPSAGIFAGVDPSILIVILVVLIPGFAEELAWRGFAVPRLLPFMSPLAAALALAVPWTILHLPLMLVPGSINEGLAVVPGVVALFSYSVILTWIFVGTGGSVLLTGLVHAGLNGVVPLFREVDPELSWVLRSIVAAGIALLVAVLGGMYRRVQPFASERT